jgi:hypothetical protein
MIRRQDKSRPHDPRHGEHVNQRHEIKRGERTVHDPGTRHNGLIQHTRGHLQEIDDPGFGSHGLLEFPLRRFVWGRVADGSGEDDLGEGGHDGGDERCEEREEEDRRYDRGERWEHEPFFDVFDSLWPEHLPQRPCRDTDPCD